MWSYHENLKQLLAYCRKKKRASTIEDEILLAVYLQYFSRRSDTRALSKRMLTEVGTLHDLVHLPPYHLRDAFGISDVLAVAISNLGITCNHMQMNTVPKEPLKTLPQYYHHLKPYFSAVNYEKTIIICLNKRQQYIATEVCTLYDPRQTPAAASLILEMAKKHRASNIILAHNHPNVRVANLSPSVADIAATDRIKEVLAAYKITLKEHVLLAYDGCCPIIQSVPSYYDPEFYPFLNQSDFFFDPSNFE